jgi:hypothetical protein
VSVESGGGWIPFILEALDYEMAENAPDAAGEVLDAAVRVLPPSDLRDNWFEHRNIVELVRAIGADNLLFETDFPHPTCLYPDPLRTADANLSELAPETAARSWATTPPRSIGCDDSLAH